MDKARVIIIGIFVLIAIWIISSELFKSNSEVQCLYQTQMFSRFGDSAVYVDGERVHWQKNNDFCLDAPESIKRVRVN